MQIALRASLISRHIKASRRIGFDRARSKELQSWFINERIPARACPHVLESFYDFAQTVGVSANAYRTPQWNIPIHADDHAFASTYIAPGSPSLIIVPAASKAERNWQPKRYAALVDAATEKGLTVTLCGGPSGQEQGLANDICSHSSAPPTNLVGKTNLKQMLALLRNAAIVIAPDTGPAHMAVSQDTPVIGLYGHSNPQRTGPYLSLGYVVEVYHHHLIKQTGKSVAQLPWGKRVKGEDVMTDISVPAVLAMLDKVCREQGIGPHAK